MAGRKHITARQRRIGAELRKMREATGMTARHAAERLGTDSIMMSQTEAGKVGISQERLRRMAHLYACLDQELIDSLVLMATDRSKGWWEEYRGVLGHAALDLAELEHHAIDMRSLQTAHVPGILQTENYVRSILTYGAPILLPPDLEALVEYRLRRRIVLDREPAPDFMVVVHESVLRTRVSDRKGMREQLAYILEQSERPNVTVRVIPFDVDGFGGAGISMLYLGGRVPRLDSVQVEAAYGWTWLDADSQLRWHRAFFDKCAISALAAAESRDFIRRVAQEL